MKYEYSGRVSSYLPLKVWERFVIHVFGIFFIIGFLIVLDKKNILIVLVPLTILSIVTGFFYLYPVRKWSHRKSGRKFLKKGQYLVRIGDEGIEVVGLDKLLGWDRVCFVEERMSNTHIVMMKIRYMLVLVYEGHNGKNQIELVISSNNGKSLVSSNGPTPVMQDKYDEILKYLRSKVEYRVQVEGQKSPYKD